MAKRKPDKVFELVVGKDGTNVSIYVLGRSPKGANAVAAAHGYELLGLPPTLVDLGHAGAAINISAGG